MRSRSILCFAVSGSAMLTLACTDPATTLRESSTVDSASSVTVAGLVTLSRRAA